MSKREESIEALSVMIELSEKASYQQYEECRRHAALRDACRKAYTAHDLKSIELQEQLRELMAADDTQWHYGYSWEVDDEEEEMIVMPHPLSEDESPTELMKAEPETQAVAEADWPIGAGPYCGQGRREKW